jgi:hypothetical protein
VPSDEAGLSWESSVAGVKEYDVQVSVDGGTTFTSAGRTSETSFAVSRPEGFHGRAQFRVVAVRADGSQVASPAVVEARPGARRSSRAVVSWGVSRSPRQSASRAPTSPEAGVFSSNGPEAVVKRILLAALVPGLAAPRG